MSPGRTRCSDPTIATMSWSAALMCSSSSLPRYSTTSARARNDPTPGPPSPMSRCSGRKPATSVLPTLRRRRLAVARRDRDRPLGRPDQPGALAGPVHVDLDEVHRRAADEAGHEPIDRRVVERLRRPDLLEEALVHDRDPRAHRHRLDLVVGDVDDGRLEALVEAGDLGAGLDAQLGVEVRERFVHQEDRRLADDRPTERDALALPAGQLLRLAIEQLLELDGLGRLVDPALDLGLGDLAQLEPEGEVLAHRHVRVERVALEDHRDVAILGRDVVDDAVADPQRPGGDLLEAGDHPQAGRLAAARWSDQDHEFAVADLQVEVLYGLEIAVHLVDVLERHRCHGATSTPSGPSRAHASSRRGGRGRAPYEDCSG